MKTSAFSTLTAILLSATSVIAGPRGNTSDVFADEQGNATVTVSQATVIKPPAVKIGVRVSEVPEALAAHLGRGGLLISNIVVGGPADLAGAARYDVIVSFAGQPVDNMKDLLSAIGKTGAHNTVDVVVIRQSREIVLQLAPLPAEEFASAELKYEEPMVDQLPSSLKFFGHRMQADPQGAVIVEPLGELHALPHEIKVLLDRDLDINSLLQDDLPFNIIDLNVDLGDFDWHALPVDPDALDDAEITMSITVTENGQTTSIHRNVDGTFEIERTDANGQQANAAYDSVEDLEQHDPAAYELYQRHVGGSTPGMILRMPRGTRLPDMQRDYQIKLKTQLDRVRERVRSAFEDARRATDSAHSIRNAHR